MVTEDLGKKGEELLIKYIEPGEQVVAKVTGIKGEGIALTDKRVYLLKWGGLTGLSVGGGISRFYYSEIKEAYMSGALLVVTLNFDVNGGESRELEDVDVSPILRALVGDTTASPFAKSFRDTVATFPRKKKGIATELLNYINSQKSQ
jgi:hypothetical protein